MPIGKDLNKIRPRSLRLQRSTNKKKIRFNSSYLNVIKNFYSCPLHGKHINKQNFRLSHGSLIITYGNVLTHTQKTITTCLHWTYEMPLNLTFWTHPFPISIVPPLSSSHMDAPFQEWRPLVALGNERACFPSSDWTYDASDHQYMYWHLNRHTALAVSLLLT